MTAPAPETMTAQQYAAAQALIVERLVAQVTQLLVLFQGSGLTNFDWENLLRLLFPYVEEARTQSSELGRRFYDAQHQAHHPELVPPRVPLVGYRLDWFAEEMQPARDEFIHPGASDHAVSMVVLRTMKAVENGGRRTIVRAVEDTQFINQVEVGWARVATGKETCGFCMMLVSRGPVYQSAESAGLDIGDTTAKELFQLAESGDLESREALAGLMTRWHQGCDCKVVPVFNRKNWPGLAAQKRALEIWKETTRGFSGKDAMNAFRRAIERGDVDVTEMSIAA